MTETAVSETSADLPRDARHLDDDICREWACFVSRMRPQPERLRAVLAQSHASPTTEQLPVTQVEHVTSSGVQIEEGCEGATVLVDRQTDLKLLLTAEQWRHLQAFVLARNHIDVS